MTEQRDKPFIVKGENAFPALRYWLKERGCNTYSFSDGRHIQVGFDLNPDSDWSRKYTNKGFIVVLDKALFDPTCKAIEEAFRKNGAFGWDDRKSA